MFKFTIKKSNIDKNKNSKNKVIFFHGFGAPCYKYNLTQWDDVKDSYYEDEKKIRTNNWLDNLVNVFNASELIYYNRPEENCLFPILSKEPNLSKAPNLQEHILKLHNQLSKPYKDSKTPIITSNTKIYLVCHSIGCAYGLKYYNMFPLNIEGIVLIDSFPLIPKIIKKYSNEKYILDNDLLKKLEKKRIFTDSEKNKWIDFIFQDITTNFKDIDNFNNNFNNKINIKLLCFWNINSKNKRNNELSREFSNLIENKFMKKNKNNQKNKNFKSIEFLNRDHYLNETDDILINKHINDFML